MADNLDLFAGLDESAPARKRKPQRRAARNAPRAPGRRSKARALAPHPAPPANGDCTAHDIEILEGLEPVRRRPGMYVGGTDQQALHHLLAELIDNAMDEAIAGHASRIEIALHDDGSATVKDNGRGIPVGQPKGHRGRHALTETSMFPTEVVVEEVQGHGMSVVVHTL